MPTRKPKPSDSWPWRRLPEKEAEWARALVDISEERDREWEARHADDEGPEVGAVYASEGGKCRRQIWYRLAGYDKEEFGVSSRQMTEIGNAIHADVQAHLMEKDRSGSVAVEVPFRIEEDDSEEVLVQGRADLIDAETVVDFKSTAGFGFEQKLKDKEGTGWGPLLQVGFAMKALRRVFGAVVFYSKQTPPNYVLEKLGLDRDTDLDAVALEYQLVWREVEPYVEDELRQLSKIRQWAKDGKAAPRHIPHVMPDNARIVDPSEGLWIEVEKTDSGRVIVDEGSRWECNYCSYQDLCVTELQIEKAALAAKQEDA